MFALDVVAERDFLRRAVVAVWAGVRPLVRVRPLVTTQVGPWHPTSGETRKRRSVQKTQRMSRGTSAKVLTVDGLVPAAREFALRHHLSRVLSRVAAECAGVGCRKVTARSVASVGLFAAATAAIA